MNLEQRAIPCIVMRGGTSRGVYCNAADLPTDRDTLAKVLIAAMGSGSPFQVDGIGGSRPTTSKVAMLSASTDDWAEIDYFFAQVHPEKTDVDFAPSCGNILSGVGPAAIEMGLVKATDPKTRIRIRSVNTDSYDEAVVQTPDGKVCYSGGASIDGVPGAAAPVMLNFMHVIGSETGALFPTGNTSERIDNIEVTCIDVATPMVIARATSFGLTGYESAAELDSKAEFFQRMEPIRIQAGKLMGLGDVSKSVIPKFGLIAAPQAGGSIAARYFMPWNCHPSFAVTGSICTGSCLLAPGTVAEGLANITAGESPVLLRIEDPAGEIDVEFDYKNTAQGFELASAGLLRTARKIFQGEIFIPSNIWPMES